MTATTSGSPGPGGNGGGAVHRDRRYEAGICTIVISTNGAFHFADG